MSGPEIDELDLEVGGLESSMAEAASMARTFASELGEVRGTLGATVSDLGKLERGFSGGLKKAIDGLVLDSGTLRDALRGFGRSVADTVYSAAMKPATDRASGALAGGLGSLMAGLIPYADGAVFSQARVRPFARGGVVSSAMTFPMRDGTGLMGEAGPEAVMPLTRGADGRLGVQAQSGGGVSVTMNISTPDVAGFQRSQGQIAAQMGRMLGRGTRYR